MAHLDRNSVSHHSENNDRPPSPEVVLIVGVTIAIGLIVAVRAIGQLSWSANSLGVTSSSSALAFSPTDESRQETSLVAGTPSGELVDHKTPTATFTPAPAFTPTLSPTPTQSPTPTVTPTPTLDLSKCNAAGCGLEAKVLPTVAFNYNLLLTGGTPTRRLCQDCPQNEQLSPAELNALIAADPATLARLQTIALSQETYEIAPGIVYMVFDYVHHVVIDLQEPGYILRNIIPNTQARGTLITPSYCLSPKSLVVIDADYHGLNGSNKTETERDMFFHLGRAALFKRDGQFDIDVIRERKEYDRTTISWGGGPIFIWDGRYDYNPEQEWFDPDSLKYYRETRWAKITAALSKDRKYLFLTASYGLTLAEHAQNIIELGERWGIEIDRALRFDGGESAYLAIRLGDYLVPVLDIEEPLIVNCLAVERAG